MLEGLSCLEFDQESPPLKQQPQQAPKRLEWMYKILRQVIEVGTYRVISYPANHESTGVPTFGTRCSWEFVLRLLSGEVKAHGSYDEHP